MVHKLYLVCNLYSVIRMVLHCMCQAYDVAVVRSATAVRSTSERIML